MSWHCSQALVAAFLEVTCLAGAPSAPSSSTPMPEAYYWPDKTTEHSRLSRFGMTSEPLTADLGAELLTWFREGFHVRTSALQADVTVLTGNDQDSGQKWRGWFAKYDRDSCSWRTAQCSLLEGSDEFSETWPQWGSMQGGACWEQTMSVPPIAESASGFWPTPVASDTTMRKNKYAQGGTPLSLAVQMWPTPVATMSKGSSPGALMRKSGRSRETDRLDHAVMASDGGTLNPDWVEWLMGWPIGWTDLRPLATAKFQRWQQQHGKYSPDREAA